MITVNASFSDKVRNTCIEADEFGTKKNQILAKPKKDVDYIVNNPYKHEQIKQKVLHTNLGLSLNGNPLTINITGQWIPWLVDYVNNINSDTKFGDIIKNSKLENNGLPDKNFICALEKYTLDGSVYKLSNKAEENEFYYIRNYYRGINAIKNESNVEKEFELSYGNKVKIPAGRGVVYGAEELPERQKECWITRGAGLYLASYGINGRTQPTAYHHLIASKMLCSKAYWFGGRVASGGDVIVEYKQPNGIDWEKCVDSNGKNCLCKNKNEDLGTCLYYSDANKKILVECDCKKYEIKKYTYNDFIENYFDVKYHLDDYSGLDIASNNKIIVDNGNQLIYNIDLHEDLLYGNKVENVGYIVASSIEKFMNACYEIQKGINGESERVYRSYFQYGPKQIYKNVSDLQNVKYSYGEKIRMFIADKYYKDNDGFYNIEVVSGIDLDDAGSFEGKLQEIEFFLLGTPKPGQSDDRADGMVAMIFKNILSSNFVNIARIIMVFMVVIYGFRVIFGFTTDEEKDLKIGVINKNKLIKMLINVIVLSVLLSNTAFQFFNKFVINFFINGTIGIVDLIAGIFSSSFITDNTISLIGGLKYANETSSLARNFAIVDEILAFFDGYTVTAKVLSFFFGTGEMFMIGCFVSTALFLVLLFYVSKLVQSIIPFIFVLLQLTLVLPLVPVCLAISLIDQAKFVFNGWLKFVVSKCLELVAFFTAFYFCTGIINNFIKMLLSFKVCFVGLGDHLMPGTDGSVGVDSWSDFWEFNWLVESIKAILNNFVAVEYVGLPDKWFVYYCINITIVFALVYMFDKITKYVMEVINQIISIEVGGSSVSASKGPMSQTENFGVSQQMQKFAQTTGIGELQKESNLLSWTRNIYDTNKSFADNMIGAKNKDGKRDGGLLGKIDATTNQFGDAVGKNLYNKIRGVETNFGNDMKKLAGKMVKDTIGDIGDDNSSLKGSILDTKTWGDGGVIREGTIFGKQIGGVYNKDDLLKDKPKKKEEKDTWAEKSKKWLDDNLSDKTDEEIIRDAINRATEKQKTNNAEEDIINGLKKGLLLNNGDGGKQMVDREFTKKEKDTQKKELEKIKDLIDSESASLLDIALLMNKNGSLSNADLQKLLELIAAGERSDEVIDRYGRTAQKMIEVMGGEDKILESVLGKEVIDKFTEQVEEKLEEHAESMDNEPEKDPVALLEEDSTSLLKEDTSALLKEVSTDLLSEDSSVVLSAIVKKAVVDKKVNDISEKLKARKDEEARQKKEVKMQEQGDNE